MRIVFFACGRHIAETILKYTSFYKSITYTFYSMKAFTIYRNVVLPQLSV